MQHFYSLKKLPIIMTVISAYFATSQLFALIPHLKLFTGYEISDRLDEDHLNSNRKNCPDVRTVFNDIIIDGCSDFNCATSCTGCTCQASLSPRSFPEQPQSADDVQTKQFDGGLSSNPTPCGRQATGCSNLGGVLGGGLTSSSSSGSSSSAAVLTPTCCSESATKRCCFCCCLN